MTKTKILNKYHEKMNDKMKVIVAKHAGFCWGVQRSVDLAMKTIYTPGYHEKKIYCLHLLVHNSQVINRLKEKGLKVVERLVEVRDNGVVIFSAHGVPPAEIDKARSRKLIVVDTTCPKVKKVQILAKKLVENGYSLVIIGDKNHPEVKGVKKWTGGKGWIISSDKGVNAKRLNNDKVGIVMQTTQDEENVNKILSKIRKCKLKDLVVYNTICDATKKRQKATKELSQKVDLMLVVGDKKSANTKRLYKICHREKVKTYFIQTEKNLKKKWFKGVKNVGLTAGASTPEWVIDNIIKKLQSYK